jgi:ribose 5-phosphate isomerase B
VISIGVRQYSADEAIRFVATFLRTPFSGEERHVRRLAQVGDYERSGTVPGPRA